MVTQKYVQAKSGMYYPRDLKTTAVLSSVIRIRPINVCKCSVIRIRPINVCK